MSAESRPHALQGAEWPDRALAPAAAGAGRQTVRGELSQAALRLWSYCRNNDWAGYDPYDALNTPLLQWPPLRSSRRARVLATQLLKYSPLNLRPLLRIEKAQNPKALALFLSAAVRLRRRGLLSSDEVIADLVGLLRSSRSAHPVDSWGYMFPWQTRTQLVPKGQANLVCTVFVANALLDAHELLGTVDCLEMAQGAARFVGTDLYWTTSGGQASLAYPLPTSRAPVHNANLLGAALLCRIHKRCGGQAMLERGLRLARHAAARQRPDGSWSYGEAPHWHWVDNFHTGFNLCALNAIARHAATSEFDETLRRGFAFYRRTFFLANAAPRYRADRTYPLDIHAVAQAMITLAELKHLDDDNLGTASAVYSWASANMQAPEGWFYYQIWPSLKIRIPYMRWSQAWMLLAMATLLSCSTNDPVPSTSEQPATP